MASYELMDEWNAVDEQGRSIQPPLSEAEVDAFEAEGLTPYTYIEFRTLGGTRYADIARVALGECVHIRTPSKPIEAAILLANAHRNIGR